jgi:hypothetical protein
MDNLLAIVLCWLTFVPNLYKSLFHANIGAPHHVIPTIIKERNRDLEQVYIHISLLTMTSSLAQTKHFYIGTAPNCLPG